MSREQQRIQVYSVKRKFGKVVTIVEGVSQESMKDIAKTLKSRLACGGTVKNNHVELQGDHREKVKEILVELGFSSEMIDLK
ncbi:MAG: stress response translation initiation inhibitor YciH [Candidatus Hadarchaeales archaeon]